MASLPCFRLPGGVGLDGGSPWGPQFLAGTLFYQSEPPQGLRPEVHVPSTWRPVGGSEGPAVSVLVVVLTAGTTNQREDSGRARRVRHLIGPRAT